ncbi:MAG: sigma-70 family RNA polymerase sigma factor [Anaerolineae bacterium]|nr:sigma-70 family RNA polymerase sigma factor [Anaerolineae bacterium]
MSELPITALLENIQAGDEEALLMLHDRYANIVYSVAYRVLNNGQDAEEVVQDVFLRVWEKAASFDSAKGNFTTWIATIARRAAIDRLRSRTRKTPDQVVSMDAAPHLWETTLVQEDMTDLQRSLLSAMSELSTEQQEAIQLAYFHGMSHADIAAHLKRPLGSVKSHIRLGMQKLRGIWLQDQPLPSDEES